MCWLYILRSESDNSFYIGITSDIERRLLEHNERSTEKYTSKKRPWALVFSKKYSTRREAMQEEHRLKQCKNRAYLMWYISTP